MTNLTKSQKRAFNSFPNGWNTESDIKLHGIQRADILALQSKGFILVKVVDGEKRFIKKTWQV